MKLNKWLYGATALAMLAACSDKDIAPDSGGGENNENKFSEGASFLGVNIQLPVDPSSRAQENDQFYDGLVNEWKVNNAAILLFKGAANNEDAAKFVGAYVIATTPKTDTNDNKNITTSFQNTIKVLDKPELSSGECYWGLAIVNYKSTHFLINTNDGNYGDLELGSEVQMTDKKIYRIKDEKPATGTEGEVGYVAAVNATTFGQFRDIITECDFLSKADNNLDGIFMTNAPLSNAAGSNGISATPTPTIHTLTKFKDNFKTTAVAAQDNPAGCIFVERAVAKITCSKFPNKVTFVRTDPTTGETSDVDFKITSVKWSIDNEEKSSYIVRKALNEAPFWTYASSLLPATSTNKYRFLGGVGMTDAVYGPGEDHKDASTYYRTYWCEDPNYSKVKEYNFQAYTSKTDRDAKTNSFKALAENASNYQSVTPLYPHENTFNVNNQSYENTTRVVFEVSFAKLQDGSDTKTVNDYNIYALRDQLKTFYTIEDAQNLLLGSVLRSPELYKLIAKYKKGDSDVTYTKDDFNIDQSSFGSAVTSDCNENNNIQVGDYILKSLVFKNTFIEENLKFDETNTLPSFQQKLDEIKNAANTANHIVPFTNNTCYYAVYIKHFGDTYCPMPTKVENGEPVDDWKGETTSTVYKSTKEGSTPEKDYLGRYGLVRNNWYDLEVSKIGRLGNAKVPDGKVPTSDDNQLEEWYLSAYIHILSWAKRTQDVQF